MNKREQKIEDAISYLNDFDNYDIYQEAWQTIYNYIEQLERSLQELIVETERMLDDGK